MSVTRLGVSLLKVVATIDSPASHHGTARPDTKNAEVLLPARRPRNSAGPKQIASVTSTMTQSRACSCMFVECTLPRGPLFAAAVGGDARLAVGVTAQIER